MIWNRCCMLLLLLVTAAPAGAQTAAPGSAGHLLVADGAETPVQVRAVQMQGEVRAGVAQTTLELEFYNPNARVLEGELQFPLADGQQVAGFALDIDGQMRAAVPVPKTRGRQVFEQVVREGVDPALLEQVAGNQFRLRVYPLPAGGTRRVQLRLIQVLPMRQHAWHWQLPLGLARDAAQVSVELRGVAPARCSGLPVDKAGRRWQGSGAQVPTEVSCQWQAPREAAAWAVRGTDGQGAWLAQVPVAVPQGQRSLPSRVGLLWDASGSASRRDRARELALLDGYFNALGNAEVSLTVLREQAEPVRRFQIRGGNWTALRQVLQQAPADGASALGSWQPDPAVQEYLLFSDGHSNWGPEALPELSAQQRLYAISSAGAHTDSARLRGWSEAHGGRLLLLDAAASASALRRLLSPAVQVQVRDSAGLREVVVDRRSLDAGWLWVHAALTAKGPASLRLRVGQGPWQTLQATPTIGDTALIGTLWAQARLQQLQLQTSANAAQIAALSQQYGLVSADTSLIVLETLQDYLRFGIRPPAPLQEEYDRAHALEVLDQQLGQAAAIDRLAEQWAQRRQWWQQTWPQTPAVPVRAREDVEVAGAPHAVRRQLGPPRPAAQAMSVPPAPAPASVEVTAMAADAFAGAEAGGSTSPALTIQLAAWQPASAEAQALRELPAAQLYASYLTQREANAGSSAFFLDVAQLLQERGQPVLAQRVLSNLAEMELESVPLLRVLGYRLQQVGATDEAVRVLERVRVLAPDEPQSHRDLGLALAAAGKPQAALQALYAAATGRWDGRFHDIGLIALDELTQLLARSEVALDVSGIDPRLRQAMPLDLRVVLAWDSDNTDMDLWVTDPDGERAFYGNRLTRIGGQMSADFTGGYGPEQFSLRAAKPGIYKVEANYYGSRQQLLTGATTLMLRLSTDWARPQQQDQQVILRLQDRRETVLVGEFEVR